MTKQINNSVKEISSLQAWDILKKDPDSVLVDVRTTIEWNHIGTPNLESLNKNLVKISWRVYPTMNYNENFIDDFLNLFKNKDTNIIFICRSGSRSRESAKAVLEIGYKNCYNIYDGFEGIADNFGNRGKINGWQANNLPWEQI